jgi:predicted DNA-binding transcriptional regulator AlpA
MTDTTERKFITAAQTCERYGGRSHMWLWRRLQDPKFPRPVVISRRNYFVVAELDAYDASCRGYALTDEAA